MTKVREYDTTKGLTHGWTGKMKTLFESERNINAPCKCCCSSNC